MTTTWSDIVTAALQEIGVINAVDAPSAEDLALGIAKANRLLDNWNADRRAVYADTITSYDLTAGLNPHTIGATGGTWTAAQRPESIEAANYVLADGTRTPIHLRNTDWWMGLSSPTADGSIPTDLYYEPAWPLGKVWLYPVPSAAEAIELRVRVLLSSITAATTFSLPPGYQDAITLTLAEELAGPMRVGLSPLTSQSAQKARARIFGNHDVVPRIRTQQAGMPGGCARGGFDYQTGM